MVQGVFRRLLPAATGSGKGLYVLTAGKVCLNVARSVNPANG